jgi:hypothetical protein
MIETAAFGSTVYELTVETGLRAFENWMSRITTMERTVELGLYRDIREHGGLSIG